MSGHTNIKKQIVKIQIGKYNSEDTDKNIQIGQIQIVKIQIVKYHSEIQITRYTPKKNNSGNTNRKL